MNKILPIIILGMMISSSGIGVIAAYTTPAQLNENIKFSQPIISETKEYTSVSFTEQSSWLLNEGKPALPVYTKTYTFPFGTTINNVVIDFGQPETMNLNKPIVPASKAYIDSPELDKYVPAQPDPSIYSQELFYPQATSKYHISVGLQADEHVIVVTVHMYPIRYNPAKSTLEYTSNANVQIHYTTPVDSVLFPDDYDLVVIAPDTFAAALQPLIDHKNDVGVAAYLKTTEEIYDEYDGKDQAEQIKYFIKDALETQGISYVLLVGGRNGGIMQEKWWTPVRYSHLDDNSGFEKTYLSDLYFSDIYKYEDNETVFEDWDSNGNGVFAEWSMFTKDILDMYPDVYVGRLACRNTRDVKQVVSKIITYETATYDEEWFYRFVGVAGDTYPGANDPYYEGEAANQVAFDLLTGFEDIFLWTSTGTLSGSQDVIDTLSDGCGFAHFSGHGNPSTWGNHPPHNDSFVDGLNVFEMHKIKNGDKLPVVFVGGCHNAQFNVSLLNIIKGIIQEGFKGYFQTEQPYGSFWLKEWVPECWAWRLVQKPRGGSIASIANTGLGYGQSGEQCTEARGRYMEIKFIQAYSEGHTNLGAAHSIGIEYYMNTFPPMDDYIDCKIAQQWALLGDPSLMIGGYP